MGALINTKSVQVGVLCLLWYSIASVSQILGKMILTEFPYFTSLTLTHLISSSIYSIPLLYFLKLRSLCVSSKLFLVFVLPLSVGKVLTSLCAHLAILKISVAFAHTIKSSVPLFTVCVCRLFFGEKQSLLVYLSLIPIVVGVGVATITELSFDLIGMIAALLATLGFSLQNIFNKRLMSATKIHSFELLAILARLSFLIALPIWGIIDAPRLFKVYSNGTLNFFETKDWWRVPTFLVVDGLLNFLQSIVAFQVLSLVTHLTYSVTNSTKRIFIIVVSLIVLQNPWTYLNVFGSCVCVMGVLSYTYAKAKQNEERTTTSGQEEETIVDSTRIQIYSTDRNHNQNVVQLQEINKHADMEQDLEKSPEEIPMIPQSTLPNIISN